MRNAMSKYLSEGPPTEINTHTTKQVQGSTSGLPEATQKE